MRGLTIIVTTADPERFRAALTLAASQAALGGRVRLYCHERAVGLLADRDAASDSPDLAAQGLPGRAELITLAREEGVALIACQTGIALLGLHAASLAKGVEAGGMVGLLATLGDDRLVTV
ncbi:DsrE/DsrF/DrsH-like family protein [Stakelama sp. CBK3Z-3]|uniref:DsrE/DsrF/DrsH-like family protein n=2 Tax=Stakelama flava TaxID=2860338 RepID=A0ABS6XHJ4_9SPHN|nr:DsrE family protein [Stakelama flava]MBW4329678.1 DsrE/DsrF/DrsH-like family protein [Stakelama flava]